MYTAPLLFNLLQQQAEKRIPGLHKQGKFSLIWRSKVGSFPSPDGETLISAGEPNAPWQWSENFSVDFGNLGDRRKTLPLNGYIPGSSIRGIVRAWAKQRQELQADVDKWLGYQDDQGNIFGGRIDFLDAWPVQPQALSKDVVNPQESFQIFHSTEKQSQPHAFYTLGDGHEPIQIIVAIQGVTTNGDQGDIQVTQTAVETVWKWLQQALAQYGIGARTAAGYGVIEPPESFNSINTASQSNYMTQAFDFELYSQGCYGPDQQPELRPTHWRGWLRGWLLRFFLGVMDENQAQEALVELMGTLESPKGQKAVKGKVKLKVKPNLGYWGQESENPPKFYIWKGQLEITGPENILQNIVLPVIRFAVMVGGVGRGWRRPLHIYQMNKKGNKVPATRGSHVTLKQNNQPLQIPLHPTDWDNMYQTWLNNVQKIWQTNPNAALNRREESFSPKTCTVYVVLGPQQDPIGSAQAIARTTNSSIQAAFARAQKPGQTLLPQSEDIGWISRGKDTRGTGMGLIYRTEPAYKRNPEVGGDASHCSWVSIRRFQQDKESDCQEIVCVFKGDSHPDRIRFIQDLSNQADGIHLFGWKP